MKKTMLFHSASALAVASLMLTALPVQAQGTGTVNAICSTDQPWCDLAAAEFQKATGIKVMQIKKPTGEALALI